MGEEKIFLQRQCGDQPSPCLGQCEEKVFFTKRDTDGGQTGEGRSGKQMSNRSRAGAGNGLFYNRVRPDTFSKSPHKRAVYAGFSF